MSLIEEIKGDILRARKAKDSFTLSVLTTFFAESSMIGKNDGNRESIDDEVVTVGRKFIKNLDFILDTCDEIDCSSLLNEKKLINNYLPQMLSEEKLREEIKNIIDSEQLNSPKQMGMIMKKLGETFKGLYDGKIASTIAKELLSS